MNVILRREWNTLIDVKRGPCASLYVALDPMGHEGRGDPLRLKKMVELAEQQLLARGYGPREVHDLLKPAYDLPKSSDWNKRGKGLAMLLSPRTSHIFRLDQPIQNEVWGDDHLHVRPLLPLVVESDEYYVLALSENRVQLYEGNASDLRPVEVPGLPKNLDDAVQMEVPDRGSQTHSALAGGHGRGGAIFHGHGGKADMAKVSRYEYVQRIFYAVERQWKQKQLPIVLAMVAEDVPDWRKVARDVRTCQDFVAGNPDYVAIGALHEEAWHIVREEGRAAGMSAYDRLANAKGTPRAIVGLAQVLPAAAAGKVDTLFMDSRTPVSGRFNRESSEVVVQHCVSETQRDLLEDALRETVLHGGQVFAFDTAGELPVACEALLRY